MIFMVSGIQLKQLNDCESSSISLFTYSNGSLVMHFLAPGPVLLFTPPFIQKGLGKNFHSELLFMNLTISSNNSLGLSQNPSH